MRRTDQTPLADLLSPTLVGAITTLVVIMAVFISYNANQGLPFVPTYDISVEVPDAKNLTTGNEVQVGGHRIGFIDRIDAQLDPRGRPFARLALKLDEERRPVRSDSIVTVRPRSPLAGKFVDLVPGRRGEPLPSGATLPLERSRDTVELEELFDEFDSDTRADLVRTIDGAGDGLTARGPAINAAIAELPQLLRDVRPILRDLADPDTRLRRLIVSTARTVGELADSAPQLVALLAAGERTLAALEEAGPALEEGIELAPGAFRTATGALVVVRPVLTKARRLVVDVRPGVRALPAAARDLTRAIDVGLPVLRGMPRLATDLDTALVELGRLGTDVPTARTLARVESGTRTAQPLLDHLAPAQLVCNYVGILVRNLSSSISEGDADGTWVRLEAISEPFQAQQRPDPAPMLHYNPYPYHASPGQPHQCEAGNEPYLPGRQIGNVPGDQGTATDDTDPSGR